MALLDATATVPPIYIHPDRVAVQYLYGSPANTTAYAMRNALLSILPNGKRTKNMSFRFDLAGNEPVHIKATKPTSIAPFCFKAYLNPLRELSIGRPSLELSKDGGRNFLRATDVRNNNGHVASYVSNRIPEIEQQLSGIALALAQALDSRAFSSLLSVKLHAIEACADLRARDPGAVVEEARPAIERNFNRTLRSRYRSAAGYRGIIKDAQMVSGFAGAGERIKAYEKSLCRVRFECALDKHALDRIVGDRALDAFSFADLFSKIAAHTAERFRLIRPRLSVGVNHRSPIEMIGLMFVDVDPVLAEQLLLTLIRNGRLHRSIAPAIINSWINRGLLCRVAVGRVAIANEYQRALTIVKGATDQWINSAVGGER